MIGYTIRSAQPGDYAAICALLAREGLPIDDVHDDAPARFHVAFGDDGVLLGCVAIERYGPEALLRSLAVLPELRRGGLGAALVATIERQAAACQAERVFLLTTTARAYFEARGYRAVDRSEASSAVRASTQFASICPQSAVCMMKRLE
ncbi:GNAT family N-acetyltransferase [Trinickia dabaoshanensis]|uniref:GNAT family N-acetyltransferase n=1 Tax=Trinickia dabaoshanensis TaxID=564714 RepID=A0A2N7VRQ1_9BURK|nr:arsenic resistance N-acetyltransferase ArsN2 [Trinickia dabaoshanensis]PMS19802.1 GNAT family N-acetyltransferase [Trinickia dabaoshanensis]